MARVLPASLAARPWPNRTTPERLDYGVDWSALLAQQETVVGATCTIAPAAGLLVESISSSATASTLWISGGIGAEQYAIEVIATTTAGRRFGHRGTLYCAPPLSNQAGAAVLGATLIFSQPLSSGLITLL